MVPPDKSNLWCSRPETMLGRHPTEGTFWLNSTRRHKIITEACEHKCRRDLLWIVIAIVALSVLAIWY